MKRTERIVLFCLFVLMIGPSVQGQESNCKNLGFELGNFAYWKGYQWVYSTTSPSKSTPKVAVTLPTSRRHVIITDYTAYDPNTGNGLKKIPPGANYSMNNGTSGCNFSGEYHNIDKGTYYIVLDIPNYTLNYNPEIKVNNNFRIDFIIDDNNKTINI